MYYLYSVDKLPHLSVVKQGTDITTTLRNSNGLVIKYPELIHTNFTCPGREVNLRSTAWLLAEKPKYFCKSKIDCMMQ